MTQRLATTQYSFFATCPRNTEGLLLEELRSLGAADAAETRAGVSFGGPLSFAYRACLWSRVASRVLLRLASLAVLSTDELYEGVHRMPWEDHLRATGTLAVEVTSTIKRGPLAALNTHFAEQRIKDAVVDRFRARTRVRPGVDIARPDIRINAHLAPAETVISIDLSGDSLHRRGYRLESGAAPLKENLAAAVLMRAGWPDLAAQEQPLVDPMCGSGTLLIEGAWMAGDIAPGLLREYFGFLGWLGFDARTWSELTNEAAERRRQGLARLPILCGFDTNSRAVSAARENARRAELSGRILLGHRDLASLTLPGKLPSTPAGLVITNPPYGKRLGEATELIELYEILGETLKRKFSGWEAAILTGNPELGAYLGLRAHRANSFFNGPIPCKLLTFKIGQEFSGRRPVATDNDGIVEHSDEGQQRTSQDNRSVATLGAEMFANRLRKNLKHLRRWSSREGVQCYRLYDADLPEFAVAVDLYDNWAHVQEYAPPSTVDPVRARRRLKEIIAVIPEVLGIPSEHTVLKIRRPQRGASQYQRLHDTGEFLEVEEGGLRFLVNLTDYLDTGLFLDHRLTRNLIRELAPGRRFLNLFAYTGSATVYAAAGGAVSTTTVDLSPTYLDWARRNLQLNGFTGPEHLFVRADCLEWLTQTGPSSSQVNARNLRAHVCSNVVYDLIFLDAPTFSNSKSMETTLDIQRDHARLIHAAAGLLSAEGILVFSTNFRRFKLNPAVAQEFETTDITGQTIPLDFARNPRIHRCYRIALKTALHRKIAESSGAG